MFHFRSVMRSNCSVLSLIGSPSLSGYAIAGFPSAVGTVRMSGSQRSIAQA